jgi:hypothetical protein
LAQRVFAFCKVVIQIDMIGVVNLDIIILEEAPPSEIDICDYLGGLMLMYLAIRLHLCSIAYSPQEVKR